MTMTDARRAAALMVMTPRRSTTEPNFACATQ